MKKRHQRILADKYEVKFENLRFKFEIYIQGSNIDYQDQFSKEKIEQNLLEYFNLLKVHGYEFRKNSYRIPLVIRRGRGADGLYVHKRKEIIIKFRDFYEFKNRSLYAFFQELTYYLIFDAWMGLPLFKDHFQSNCRFLHMGLVSMFPHLVKFGTPDFYASNFVTDLHRLPGRNLHFSDYLVYRFLRSPKRFCKILRGNFLADNESFERMNRLVEKLKSHEISFLHSTKTTLANFIVTDNSDCDPQKGFAIYFNKDSNAAPIVSPIIETEIKDGIRAKVYIEKNKPLFRDLKRVIKKPFTELPHNFYRPVIEILGKLRKFKLDLKSEGSEPD
jgi:type III secretion system FlhB-like substrate exporter